MKKNKMNLTNLPEEPMIGIGLINSQCVVDTDEIKKVLGLEIGLLFVNIRFIRII